MTKPETVNPASFEASILHAIPDPLIWVRPLLDSIGTVTDFEVKYSNKAADNGINHPKGTLTGLRILQDGVPSKESAQGNFQHFLDVYLSGELKEYTFFAHHSNKQYETIRQPHDGGVLSITRDRRAEREAVSQLELQQHLTDNILKHSSNGISVGKMIRDESGRIIDMKTLLANDAAVKYTGFPKDDYLSKTAAEVDPTFIGSPYFQACIKCMETGEPFITQYYLESVKRWMEISVSKMDEERQIYIFTDVTTIKEAQLAIERSEAQLYEIINRTQSGILTASPIKDEQGEVTDFRFVIVNRTLAAYLNQEPERLIGEPGSKWFTGYKTNGLFNLFYDTYINRTVNRFDFHYVADGIDAWIDVMCTRFDGEILITFTDYTPVKKLQLELQSSVEELKRSNRHLEDFAHAASHDMKEPLRKIRTFTDRLKHSMGSRMSEQETKMIERVETAAERMQLLVDDLLEFSHVSEGPQKMESIDLNEKVKKVLSDLDLPIEEKGARVEVEQLPTVQGNRHQLQQLFYNLIGNALKYSKPDTPPVVNIQSKQVSGLEVAPFIHLTLDQENKTFHLIEVSDNGIGFDQQYAEQIFGMFQRLHGKVEYSGTGVGLSIARKVIENHNGYIWATSEPDKGATFYVLLPV